MLETEYLDLLDEKRAEQDYQAYLEQNTKLIPREFVQNHGIHFRLVLRKLAFGSDYKTDFVYLSKSSDDWNCVLVEIERPDKRFFKDRSNDFHAKFGEALQQINRWKAWFLNADNKASFVNGTLRPIRIPLEQNPTFMKYILVYGRRSEYANNETRRKLVAAQENLDFKILTFDSLGESLDTKSELYVGARRNEYVDILSEKFLSEQIFSWMEPEQVRISERLRESALAARGSWHSYRSIGKSPVLAMDYALERVRIRS